MRRANATIASIRARFWLRATYRTHPHPVTHDALTQHVGDNYYQVLRIAKPFTTAFLVSLGLLSGNASERSTLKPMLHVVYGKHNNSHCFDSRLNALLDQISQQFNRTQQKASARRWTDSLVMKRP